MGTLDFNFEYIELLQNKFRKQRYIILNATISFTRKPICAELSFFDEYIIFLAIFIIFPAFSLVQKFCSSLSEHKLEELLFSSPEPKAHYVSLSDGFRAGFRPCVCLCVHTFEHEHLTSEPIAIKFNLKHHLGGERPHMGGVGLVVWYGTLLVSCLYGMVSVRGRTYFNKITV